MSRLTQIEYNELVKNVGSQINAGKYKQALENARHWAKVAPKSPDAKYWLAWLYSKLKKHPDALKVIKEVVESGLKHPAFEILLAKCYLENGESKAALLTARNVNHDGFNNTRELNTLGALYSYLGEFKDALSIFRKIVSIEPQNAFAHYQKGMSENFCHYQESAESSFLKVLELDPKFFRAYYLLSQLRKQTQDNNHIELWKQRLQEYQAYEDCNIFLNLALFKEYEDTENYSDAFIHLAKANTLIASSSDYNAQSEIELTDKIIEVYSRDFVNSSKQGFNSTEPVFIIGMPRTGTTLVEKILSSDRNVYSAGELNNFNIAFSKISDNLNSRGDLAQILENAREIDYCKLGELYIESTRPNTGKTKYFIDKMPFNFRLIGAILMALPNAKIIYLTRNPMDTCFSNYKQLFQSGVHTSSYSFENIANQYVMFDKLMKHWKSLFGDRIHEISYERLVNNQELESKRLIHYCGLDWDDKIMEFHKNAQASSTASVAQIRLPIYKSSVEKWKFYEKELEPLKSILLQRNIDV